ncbi:MAG: NfeD family protein [Betaproteobacteria bacterium]|nr:NfeD family protein [Betaproteobacteria bacterium]
MASYLVWALAGFLLIVAELLTGTFYLLVLGVAALVGAAIAYLGGSLGLQIMLVAAAALVGVHWVRRRWQTQPKAGQASNDLDAGQPVVLEAWVDEAAGMGRVRYRGTDWDAKVTGSAQPKDTLYIVSQHNGVLQVTAKP